MLQKVVDVPRNCKIPLPLRAVCTSPAANVGWRVGEDRLTINAAAPKPKEVVAFFVAVYGAASTVLEPAPPSLAAPTAAAVAVEAVTPAAERKEARASLAR